MKREYAVKMIIGCALLLASVSLLLYATANLEALDDLPFHYTVMLGAMVIGLLIGGLYAGIQGDLQRQKAKRARKIAQEDLDNDEMEDPAGARARAQKSSAPQPEYMPFWVGRQIDFVVIAHSSDRVKAGSAAMRGAVGGAIGGLLTGGLAAPIGAAAGMMSSKRKGFLDLIIYYKSGKVQTKRVAINSREYRRLARYIRA